MLINFASSPLRSLIFLHRVCSSIAGIAMLTFALFMSARMGIYQETVYAKHGKHPREALFYNVRLPLPSLYSIQSDSIVCYVTTSLFFTSPFFSLSLQHALPLPGFILLAKDIYEHAIIFNNSGNSAICATIKYSMAYSDCSLKF